MFSLAGMLLVLAAVIGGFLLENGDLLVLLQPAEFLIICGGAIGTLMTANPPAVLMGMVRGTGAVLRKKRFTHDEYRETLRTFYGLFQFARRNSGTVLEAALDAPRGGAAFRGNCALVLDADIRDFVCDTLRTAVSGVVSPGDLDGMLESDIEVREHYRRLPVESLGTVGETLPGLGIVAAVLGVLITMAKLGGPPAEVGRQVATALVGTFLGILLSYGLVLPLAEHIRVINDAQEQYFRALRAALVAHARGVTPRLSVEFARRMIPAEVRPGFDEMDRAFRSSVRSISDKP